MKCECGSYAINKHRQGVDSKLDQCDVCYWKDRSFRVEKELDEKKSLLFRALNLLHSAEWWSVESSKAYKALLSDSQNWELWGQN